MAQLNITLDQYEILQLLANDRDSKIENLNSTPLKASRIYLCTVEV